MYYSVLLLRTLCYMLSLPNCFLFLISYESTCSHASRWKGKVKNARNEGRNQEMKRPVFRYLHILHIYISLTHSQCLTHSLSFSLAQWFGLLIKLLLLLFNKIYVPLHSFLFKNIINMFEFVVVINYKYWADKNFHYNEFDLSNSWNLRRSCSWNDK